MGFDPLGFALATAMTAEMPNSQRAEEIRLLGGMLGGNLAGVVLLAATARETAVAEAAQPPAAKAGAPAPAGVVAGAPAVPGPSAVAPAVAPVVALVQIPDVVDAEDDRAVAELESLGLVVVTEKVETRDAEIGHVIVVEPAPLSVVARGSEVKLLVGGGVTVPDVTGMRVDEAEEQLKVAGFDVERRNHEKADKHGVVESQEPAAGTMTDPDTTVTIHVITARRRGQLHSAPGSDEE